jgi:hypothetical protein
MKTACAPQQNMAQAAYKAGDVQWQTTFMNILVAMAELEK